MKKLILFALLAIATSAQGQEAYNQLRQKAKATVSDPKANKNAVKYDKLALADVINKELHVMDITAASLCKDNHMPILVFNLENPDNIVAALSGKNVGTIVE